MNLEQIAEIGIDSKQRLYVKPQTRSFPFIYREAMEIHWENEGEYLFAPEPPRGDLWPPERWFEQILHAARLQSVELVVTGSTRWINIPDALREKLMAIADPNTRRLT
ncbi:MAG TPA: hypothetical protein VFT46_02050 [Holophagaceae bacterium]|nr:hypothetical protein [Holophagaceae bacterium]